MFHIRIKFEYKKPEHVLQLKKTDFILYNIWNKYKYIYRNGYLRVTVDCKSDTRQVRFYKFL